MKLAYNGKIRNHWAKHRAQAIALLATRIELNNTQNMHIPNNAPYSP